MSERRTINGIHTLVHGGMHIDICYSASPIDVWLDSRVWVTGDGEPRAANLEDIIPDWHTLADIRDRIHRGHYEQR